ncbi:MAG: TetR/AcrR family transcriptional regulator [Spirochaetaceae bacterium]|nr:MAG: TetR/AcrR family transcriptional regulator [Spirochaetaceae bacterium]
MGSNKRDLFLKVGERLFSRYGYKDVNIEDITKEAGVGTGSFYTYFSSKEGFYEQILDNLESQGIRSVDRLVGGFKSPVNKMKALYRFTTLGIKNNPILLGILTGDKKYIYPGQQNRLAGKSLLRSHVEKVISQIIREGSRKGVFRVRQYKNPRRMVLAIYDAILMNLDSVRAEDLMNDILRLLERGLKRRVRLPGSGTLRDRRKVRRSEE